MYKFSEIVGINLIDTDKSEELGAIKDVIWDKLSGKCAFLTDNGAYTAEKIVFTDGETMNIVAATQTDVGETLVEKVAYETTGKCLGKVADLELGKTMKLFKVYLEDETDYRRGRICGVKDVLILRAPTPPRPKKEKVKTTVAPTAAEDATASEQPIFVTDFTKRASGPWKQNRKYGDFSFLIGKVTDKTITNFQGEVMVKLGERVTADILRQAKISGKLIELCLHTK